MEERFIPNSFFNMGIYNLIYDLLLLIDAGVRDNESKEEEEKKERICNDGHLTF